MTILPAILAKDRRGWWKLWFVDLFLAAPTLNFCPCWSLLFHHISHQWRSYGHYRLWLHPHPLGYNNEFTKSSLEEAIQQPSPDHEDLPRGRCLLEGAVGSSQKVSEIMIFVSSSSKRWLPHRHFMDTGQLGNSSAFLFTRRRRKHGFYSENLWEPYPFEFAGFDQHQATSSHRSDLRLS